jgi:hypothetical protein
LPCLSEQFVFGIAEHRAKRFRALEASDGSKAMELMRAYGGELEAILLDVTLPGHQAWRF